MNSAASSHAGDVVSEAELAKGVDLVLDEMRHTLRRISYEEVGSLVRTALNRRLFFAGEGRSGMVARMAAMRLTHLGRPVHVVGETTTPALGPDDALIVLSGSGRSRALTALAEVAKAAGGSVLVVTASPGSPLARAADHVITVMAAAKDDHSGAVSAQFSGSLFEQSALVLFDSVLHTLRQSLATDTRQMWSRHTNLG